jgi:hypothetical protein
MMGRFQIETSLYLVFHMGPKPVIENLDYYTHEFQEIFDRVIQNQELLYDWFPFVLEGRTGDFHIDGGGLAVFKPNVQLKQIQIKMCPVSDSGQFQ